MMRVIFILTLVAYYSCNSSIGEEITKVKWDFYKKNTNKYFVNQTDTIAFYKCNLEVTKIDIEGVDLICYSGEFEYGDLTSRNSSSDNFMSPTVDIICYNGRGFLSRYYLMSNAYIDVHSQKKETEEDDILAEIIVKDGDGVVAFLKNYKLK